MPSKVKLQALLPILNDTCVTFSEPAWWIGHDIQFTVLTDAEARLLQEQAPEGVHLAPQPGQQAIVLAPLPPVSKPQRASVQQALVGNVALACQLAFAFIGGSNPLVIPYAAIVSLEGTPQVHAFHQFEIWGDATRLRKGAYTLKPGIAVEDVSALVLLARSSLASNPALAIPLRRYCSALIKTDPHDKLIDLTIALESLVPGGGEFRFRFPYFLSLLVSADTPERMTAFADLQLLYEARSALVHGTTDNERKVSLALANWPSLLSMSRKCILYRMHFQTTASGKNWNDHLADLSYGAEPIV